MHVIPARNINDAVARGLTYLLDSGIEEQSRNGPVLVAPGPVVTVYERPLERVLFSPTRDANPFFHLMEALWMLDGRNDIAWPVKFNSKFINYSDDGKTQFGAYGWRWREFFGCDQLKMIADELRRNPESRRCVLSMWNGMCGEDHNPDNADDVYHDIFHGGDLYVAMHGGKDVPCNTHAYFDCRGGKLNMTVCNRSNDVIWGAYGANVVHFSMLQEYMAAMIGMPIGEYRQFSNNFHAYTEVYDRDKLFNISEEAVVTDVYYTDKHLKKIPLVTSHNFGDRLESFLDTQRVPNTEEDFFTLVAVPMFNAWEAYKAKNWDMAYTHLSTMPYCDWNVLATKWMGRRERNQHAKGA